MKIRKFLSAIVAVAILTAGISTSALAAGTFKSDTNSNFSVKPGASYTFKITANGTAPTFTFGTGGVFTSKLTGRNGNDYFYKITATGKSGTATGVYVSGTRVCVASISGNSTSTVNTPNANTAYKDYTRPFNVDAILKDMIAAGEARGMVYTPEFGVDAQGNPLGHCGYYMPGDTFDYDVDYNDSTYDYSYWLHKNCMEAVTRIADDAVKLCGTSQGVRFKPLWVKQDNGEYLFYVLYG